MSIRAQLEAYDREVARGITHHPDYMVKMEQYRLVLGQ